MASDREHGDRVMDTDGHDCFKVVLLGDARVGKTCLTQALKHDLDSWQLPNEYKPTAGAWVTYFDVSDTCRLLVFDTSGRQEFAPLVQLYLRQLHCVVFAFALDDPSSLKRLEHWYRMFNQEFAGDVNKVAKFVVGTKMDLARSSGEAQLKAAAFAEAVGAEMWITSAATAFNIHELFTRISEHATQMSLKSLWAVPKQIDHQDGACVGGKMKSACALDDSQLGKGALVQYPEPMLLDTGGVQISNITMAYQCVTMTGEGRTFKWGTWSNRSLQEATMKEDSQTHCDSSKTNQLWSCVMSKAPPSTWQHENLSGEMVLRTTVRRQPTMTMFKNFKKLLFSSSDMYGRERDDGLFYVLFLTEEGSLFECGLSSLSAKSIAAKPCEQTLVHNHFQLKPKPCYLQVNGKVTSLSVSESHAAVVLGENKTVLTWGRGRDGALGLEENLITNFDPPTPVPVTSINCKVSQVACGIGFTLMLNEEGQILSCGSGQFGKLGHGDETDRLLPAMIPNLWNVKAIAAGSDHALVLTTRGTLYQWGLECADEDLTRFNTTPTRVQQIDNVSVTAIACGLHHSVCVANGAWYGGIPYAWGRGSSGRLGLGHCHSLFVPRYVNELYGKGVVVTQVSAGRMHTGFLTKKGDVYTCGSNEFGQLGFFTPTGYSEVPRKVDLGKNVTEVQDRATEICCHEDYTMISTEQGKVLLWGKCFYGPKIDEPIRVNLTDSDKPVHIMDVTTCHVQWEESEASIIELVLALTSNNTLVFCAGIECESDSQVAVDCKPGIPCDKTSLTTLSSVGSVLVATDRQGKCYFTDFYEWLEPLLRRKDFVHQLFSFLKESQTGNLPQVKFTLISSIPGNVVAVESSLTSFLFCTDIGDMYSWTPCSGGKLVHHSELNGEIVVQIACGANHFAALTDDGALFTCGSGSAGQLGCGTYQYAEKFQLVSLTQFEKVQTVCCGWASTSVLTLDGKVFFWGQLDLPRGEKRRKRLLSISTCSMPRTLETIPAPQASQTQPDLSPPVPYKLKFIGDVGNVAKHFAVVGRPFEFQIVPRSEDVVNNFCVEFRVEARNQKGSRHVHSKGKIKQHPTSEGAYGASIDFHSEGVFKVTVTRNGQHILGSPFGVTAENGVSVTRCKLSLIGCDIECLRAVGGALQQSIKTSDVAVELWCIPSIITELQTYEACMLASVTDGGIFVYVWDACSGSLSEEHLNYWLHLLALRAPTAPVVVLGVNCSAAHANEIDLRPFQKANSRLTQAIFVGTTFSSYPKGLSEELQAVVDETKSHQRPVWYRLEILASRIVEKRKSRVEILDEHSFKCLAGECGIHGGTLCKEAADYLEMVGLGLVLGREEHFLVVHSNWLTLHLTEMAKSSHCGALDGSTLDVPKQQIAEFLIQKGVAMRRIDGSTIDIMPYLSSVTEVNWPSVVETDYTVYRHLILSLPPFHLHSIFQRLAANVLQLYEIVSLGKYSLVVHTEQYDCRTDVGPCAVNKTVAEIRVTVRARNQDFCMRGAESAVEELQGFLTSVDVCDLTVKVSCNICRRQYIDLCDVQEAAAEGKGQLKCAKCGENKLCVSDVLSGFKETRPSTELDWNPFSKPAKQGGPQSNSVMPSSQTLLRPLMRYFGDREERQRRILVHEMQEIREMIRNMAKVFADTKYYTTPRTVSLLPEFQRSSVLKKNALQMLLTWGQPKYRLFLLCEGNGDGTGVHFLDKKKHGGYPLETNVANGLISDCVGFLRFGLQLLLPAAAVVTLSRAQGYLKIEDRDEWETLNNILGTVGLSGAMLCKVQWKSHFKEMDAFLKSFQETAKSIQQPKELSKLCKPGIGFQVSDESYQHLRKLLSEVGTKDDFGGLRQEPREGIGAIWVCDKHSMYNNSTKEIKVMP